MARIVTSAGDFDRSRGVRGELSNINKLQDGYYYQQFSYVIRSDVSLNKWQSIVLKTLHPAGMKLFGDVVISSLSSFYNNTRYPSYQNFTTSVGIVVPTAASSEDSFTVNSTFKAFSQTYVLQNPEMYILDDYVATVTRGTDSGIPVSDQSIKDVQTFTVVYI